MMDKFKTFVSKHKKEFDTEEPSEDLWKKINAGMDVKDPSTISSKWLSKLKYVGLSASILMITVYIISQNLSNSSSKELAQNKRDSALNNSDEWVKANQNKKGVNEAVNNIADSSCKKSGSQNKILSLRTEHPANLIQNNIADVPKDSIHQNTGVEIGTDPSLLKAADKSNANHGPDKNENLSTIKIKKGKIGLPADVEKANSYSGTLYDGYSLCSVIRAYKFTGQVSMDEGGIRGNDGNKKIALKTISCSRLENTPNMKAVWLKGKTDKKMTLSIKEGLKNILLVKKDGRELPADAISHYYPGLGVISDYNGKYFDMIFKDKVELILFFKEAEEGDKIRIDGTIEVIVKSAP